MKIDIVSAKFQNSLALSKTSVFRGCVLNELGNDCSELFHNHQGDDGFRQQYPLIQYKSIDNKATILFIGKGVVEVGKILSICGRSAHIGRRTESLVLNGLTPFQYEVTFSRTPIKYRIKAWLPLNETNVKIYQSEPLLVPRLTMLEDILVANILSMSKGLGVYIDQRVECGICSISSPYTIECKQVPMVAFDVDFLCNMSLPDDIGLGKHVSLGFGLIKRMSH